MTIYSAPVTQVPLATNPPVTRVPVSCTFFFFFRQDVDETEMYSLRKLKRSKSNKGVTFEERRFLSRLSPILLLHGKKRRQGPDGVSGFSVGLASKTTLGEEDYAGRTKYCKSHPTLTMAKRKR